MMGAGCGDGPEAQRKVSLFGKKMMTIMFV